MGKWLMIHGRKITAAAGLLLVLGGGWWVVVHRGGSTFGNTVSGWRSVNQEVAALLPTPSEVRAARDESTGKPVDARPSPSDMSAAPSPSTEIKEGSDASISPSSAAAAGERTPAPSAGGGAASLHHTASSLIDLNTASASRLTELPNIGPSKAKAIIAYREANGGFREKAELMKVKGIGEKTFEKLKDRITLTLPR